MTSLTLPYFFQEFRILDGNTLPFGLVCFLVILTLERLLIRSMGHHPVAGLQKVTMKNGLGIFLRILLAIVMGALISIPLEHKVFEQNINEYLAKKQMESVQILEQERDTKRNKIYDHYNPILLKLDEEYNDLNDRYLRELDGSGGTELRGNGAIARAKKAVCDSIAAKRKAIAGELNAAISKIDADFDQKLKHLEASFSTGIIARHEALWQLTNDKWSVLLIVILLKLFFLLLDVTPMIAKYMNHTKYYDTHELVMEQAFKNTLATEIELETNRINDLQQTKRTIQEQFYQDALSEAKEQLEIQYAQERNNLRKQAFKVIADGQHQMANDMENHAIWLQTLSDDVVENAFKQEIQDFLDMHYKRNVAF